MNTLFTEDTKGTFIKSYFHRLHADLSENDREDYDLSDEFLDSIRRYGILEPLTVRKGLNEDEEIYIISHGFRRYCALAKINETDPELVKQIRIPIITEPKGTNEATRAFMHLAKNNGKSFTPVEMGKVFVRLLGYRFSQAEIAKETGISPSRVSQCLKLMELPQDLVNGLKEGKISENVAKQINKDTGGDKDKIKQVLDSNKGKIKPKNLKPKTLGFKKLSKDEALALVQNVLDTLESSGSSLAIFEEWDKKR